MKIGLALGGGVVYGFAHIGVLRVLEQNGIIPDIIAGTSIGSLIGGAYASGMEVKEIEKMGKNLNGRK
jgi:NTE family protein